MLSTQTQPGDIPNHSEIALFIGCAFVLWKLDFWRCGLAFVGLRALWQCRRKVKRRQDRSAYEEARRNVYKRYRRRAAAYCEKEE